MSTPLGKKWYKSKTVWINVIALAGVIYEASTGNALPLTPELQGSILAGLNLILRLITKEQIIW